MTITPLEINGYSSLSIFQELLSQQPQLLKNAPKEPGIYLLYSHDGSPSYVGASTNIYGRIMNHVSGDGRQGGNSHKFTQLYKTGLMWFDRLCIDKEILGKHQTQEHVEAVKKLRKYAVRQDCRCAFFVIKPVPDISLNEHYKTVLKPLEENIIDCIDKQGCIGPSKLLWNNSQCLTSEFTDIEGWQQTKVEQAILEGVINEEEKVLILEQLELYQKVIAAT
ncbi:GIY-YIG nuclease family protein [Photobacterium sagamiensis]|uniref:GIY-YIG nuclease family protein n=1 Tax=Photobacterium sagamiensis TaxID=2910241 RepID=UPI003D1069A8